MDQAKLRSLFDLSGRVAIVTGAARGLGRAYAVALAAAGARVVVDDHDGEGATETVGLIAAISTPLLASGGCPSTGSQLGWAAALLAGASASPPMTIARAVSRRFILVFTVISLCPPHRRPSTPREAVRADILFTSTVPWETSRSTRSPASRIAR